MRPFQYIASPPRVFSGPECLGQLGRELDRAKASRAVVVCGATLGRPGSVLDTVLAALGDRCAGVFSGVAAHSPVPAVEAAADALRHGQADAVIAVGGGSAIVTARAAAILLAEGSAPRALATTRDERGQLKSPRLMAPKLPQFVIPTTPTTAAVKAGSAIFDPVMGERLALFDPKARAQAVFVHPDMLRSAPDMLIVTSALDTLSLALEGLMSRTGNPIADAQLMHAIRLIAAHLPAAMSDIDARVELAHAAILSGLGSDHTGAGVATVLGHAVGAAHGTDNGIVKAIVLPHAIRFNAAFAEAGLAKIAAALGLASTGAEDIVAALVALFSQLPIPRRLRDAGVPRDALPGIAEHGMSDWFLRGNPRSVTQMPELLQILEPAW